MTDKEMLIATARSLRGTIIDEWIYLEKSIDRFIANHLSKDQEKRYEIMSLLLDRLTFEHKKNALKAILDKDDDIDRKSKKRPHAELIEEIRKVNLERNYFAHYYLNTHESAISKFKETGEISFIEFRDGHDFKTYPPEKYTDLINRIQACMFTLTNAAVK